MRRSGLSSHRRQRRSEYWARRRAKETQETQTRAQSPRGTDSVTDDEQEKKKPLALGIRFLAVTRTDPDNDSPPLVAEKKWRTVSCEKASTREEVGGWEKAVEGMTTHGTGERRHGHSPWSEDMFAFRKLERPPNRSLPHENLFKRKHHQRESKR